MNLDAGSPSFIKRASLGAALAVGALWHLGLPAAVSSSDQGNASWAGIPSGEENRIAFPGISRGAETTPDVVAASTDIAPVTVLPLAEVSPPPESARILDLEPDLAERLSPAALAAEASFLNSVFASITAAAYEQEWLWPVANGTPVTGAFGEKRTTEDGSNNRTHVGTDFGAGMGSPVYAANGGTVVLAQELNIRGNTVVVDHGDGIFTLYAHLSSIGVETGDVVSGGQPLGAVGTTGVSTGAHLHWEVVAAGVRMDGFPWLTAS